MKPSNVLKKIYTIKMVCILMLTVFSGICFGQIRMTLKDAVEQAMKNSPDIQRTRFDLERNEELLIARLAAKKPNFSLSLNPFSYSTNVIFNQNLSKWITNDTKESFGNFRISQPIEKTNGTLTLNNRFSWQDSYSDYNDIRNKEFSNNLYLSFSQPIFTYNQLKLETRELELNLEKTQLTFTIQELLIERQVAQSFYSCFENKMNYEIALDEQINQEASHQIIKNKVNAELAALEELYQAELNLLSSQSTVQNSLVTLENSLDNLKQIIGLPLSEELTIEADTTHKTVMVDLTKAVQNGHNSRLELRQRKIDIETAEFDLIQTSAQNEFKGNVTLSYGLIGTDETLGNVIENPSKNQTVGISFEIPLFDWGEKEARIKASEATIKRQKLTYDDEIINISIEIRQTYRRLKNLAFQIEIARKNVSNAELTYDINLERYKYGDLTSMDLNLYQTQLSQKKTQFISALVDYKLAMLDLKIQSLWDFENDKPVLDTIK